MAEDKKKAQYAKPASQVDLEERLDSGNKSSRVLSTADTFESPKDSGDGRDFRVEDNEIDEYVGTDTVYATYANETEKPLAGEGDSAETKVFQQFADGLASEVPEDWSPDAESKEDETTAEPADSADDETPDGDPVPQSATTSSTKSTAKKTTSSSS